MIQDHGRRTVTPAKDGDFLLIASTPLPIWRSDSIVRRRTPPSPPASLDSDGTRITSRVSTATVPIHSTLSETLFWSLRITNPTVVEPNIVNIVYSEKPIDDAASWPNTRPIKRIMAITIRGTETLLQ